MTRLARITLDSLACSRIEPPDDLLDEGQPVGGDGRHAGERQFERHGAGRRQRRTRLAESGPLFGRLDHDARRHRPAGDALAHLRTRDGAWSAARVRSVRHARRRARSRRRKCRARRRISLDRLPGRTSTTGGSARRRRVSSAFGAQFADALDQRMADIATRRPAEPQMRGRLERQDRKHGIDIGAHRAGAPGPPRPHRGRNVIEDRNRGRAPAHPARHLVGEIRTVDNDEGVRTRGDDAIGGFANAARRSSAAAAGWR